MKEINVGNKLEFVDSQVVQQEFENRLRNMFTLLFISYFEKILYLIIAFHLLRNNNHITNDNAATS